MGDRACVYWGVFFDEGEPMFEPSLDTPIGNRHVTMGFREPCSEELLGEEASVLVVGYGNDGANEGLEVELPDWLEAWLPPSKTPHVTLSVASGSAPKLTGDIAFEPIEPYEITGRIGYFGFDQKTHFE